MTSEQANTKTILLIFLAAALLFSLSYLFVKHVPMVIDEEALRIEEAIFAGAIIE